jgi:hypothetical protein
MSFIGRALQVHAVGALLAKRARLAKSPTFVIHSCEAITSQQT